MCLAAQHRCSTTDVELILFQSTSQKISVGATSLGKSSRISSTLTHDATTAGRPLPANRVARPKNQINGCRENQHIAAYMQASTDGAKGGRPSVETEKKKNSTVGRRRKHLQTHLALHTVIGGNGLEMVSHKFRSGDKANPFATPKSSPH